MSSQLKILITRATGYIGRGVLTCLLKHRDASSFSITALVQSVEKGEKLKTLGVNIIIGSYSDANLSFLTDETAVSDIVFAIADSDQLPPAQAILKGLKIKFKKSGKAPVLIHTSGTAFISDDACGLNSDYTTYSDFDVEKLNGVPESVFHRNVDIPIIEADKAGYVKSYIIIPSAIYGRPSANPIGELRIQNIVSLIPGYGAEGYYFASNFYFPLIEMAHTISEALAENGIGSKEPSSFTKEEIETTYGLGSIWTSLAANFYAKADCSRALGWNLKGTKEDFLGDVRDEVKLLLAESSNSL